MPRGKKRVTPEAKVVAEGFLSGKTAPLRAKLGQAKSTAHKAKQAIKALLTDYEFGDSLKRPATAKELARGIEGIGRGIERTEDMAEDHERRLRAIEAKLFPEGSPAAGVSTEQAFATSLANSIASKGDKKSGGKKGQQLVDALMASGQGIPLPDAANAEGEDII